MKRHFSFFSMLVCMMSIFLLVACKSKEEQVISDLNSLCERIETKGADFDSDDWAKVAKEYEEIHAKVSECDFTSSQLAEVGKAEAKIVGAVAAQGTKSLLKQGGDIINGFLEGLGN